MVDGKLCDACVSYVLVLLTSVDLSYAVLVRRFDISFPACESSVVEDDTQNPSWQRSADDESSPSVLISSSETSVVVMDLALKDENKDKESSLKDKDKDEDLKIGPRGSSRTRSFLEDNNTV